MQNPDLIQTVAGGLTAALILGYLTHRIGLSPIVGYLLAGVMVGPFTPGFVANHQLAEQLADIGVILLMFSVGLHFQFGDLMAVRRIALPGAIGQSAVAALLGMLVARSFGWSWSAGLVFGLAISVASTVVMTRVLSDANELHTPVGNIAIGWLVVQDLFAVFVLVLLPELFGEKTGESSSLPMALLFACIKIGVLVAGVFFVGGRFIPWLLKRVSATHSRELFTLTILVVALGIAVGSMKLFGVSMALGAFLAGMVVGRSDFSIRAATEALPMRDAFAVLFFVSVGMLFDPGFLLKAPGLVIASLMIVMLGTPVAALVIVVFRGYPLKVALTLALSLAQIGEFSFILATFGRIVGVLPEEATQVLVAVAIVTISVNPLLLRLVGPVDSRLARNPRIAKWLASRSRGKVADKGPLDFESDATHRAVIVGYGPVGRTLARLLRDNGIEPTIVEMNLDTVQKLRDEGKPAVYGDANHPETLKEAGLARAASLILSASGIKGGEEVIRVARELNPGVHILIRSSYLHERAALRKAGADAVFAGEGEVALAMTESILTGLGATPDQIDRARAKLREDLFGAEGGLG